MTKQQPPSQTPPPYPGYPAPFVVYPPEEPINWGEYWRVLVKNRKLIGIITAASTLIALLIAFLLPPVYRAEVLLAPVTQDKSEGLSAIAGQYGDVAALAGINLGPDRDKTAEYVAALKSRSLSVAFINEENLKPVLFPRNWDDEGKKWKDSSKIPTDWDTFKVFDEDIRTVRIDRKTSIVTLAIEWKDAALAAKWANSLVRRVNARLRNEAIEEAERSIGYLEKQLVSTSAVEIQQAIYRLIEGQTKKKMVASTRDEYAFSVIDPAVPPEKKVKPRRILIVVFSFLASVIIGTVVAFAIYYVKSRADFTEKSANDKSST